MKTFLGKFAGRRMTGEDRPRNFLYHRSSSFSPLSLSPALWLKADAGLFTTAAGSTPVTTDGTEIGRWEDQSGNGRHLTQATATKLPILKLGILNNLPVIRFDGTNDFIACAAGVSIIDTRVPHTLYAVLKASTDNRTVPCGNMVGAFDQGVMIDLNSGAADRFTWRYHDGVTPAPIEIPAVETNSFAVWGALCAATAQIFRRNGVEIGTGAITLASNTYGVAPFAVGDGMAANVVPFNGDVAELLLFTSALSDANRNSLETYLNSRWAAY